MSRSRPVRGAWIETRSPCPSPWSGSCRAPCGARGLKPHLAGERPKIALSRPVRGAWIETQCSISLMDITSVAPRAGRVD